MLTLILLGLVGSPASADLGADSKLLLLFVKLRPNKTRSKMHVYDLATQWAAEVKVRECDGTLMRVGPVTKPLLGALCSP